jgi:hypothetical protein
MAFTSVSLQGVRPITPLSSRLRRASEDYEGAAKSAMQMESAKEKIFETKMGTSNPYKRSVQESAQKALIASQQAAIQGNYNDDIVGPLRQEFFTGADNLPTYQQAALYNRYTPEIMQQQMLGQQQQKSFLQLKDAQRKARMAQAADALQAPVSQRLEEIMGSGTSLKQKYNDIQQSLFSNPAALGSPLLASLYQTSLQTVGSQLSDKQKQDNMEKSMRINLAYKAIEIGDSQTAQDLLSFKEGQSSTLQEYAKNLAESKKRYEAGTSGSKAFESLLSSYEKVPLREAQDVLGSIAKSPLDQLKYDAFVRRKTKIEAEGVDTGLIDTLTLLASVKDKLGESYPKRIQESIDLNDQLVKVMKGLDSSKLLDSSKTTGATTGKSIYDDIKQSGDPDEIQGLLQVVAAYLTGKVPQAQANAQADKEMAFSNLFQ